MKLNCVIFAVDGFINCSVVSQVFNFVFRVFAVLQIIDVGME